MIEAWQFVIRNPEQMVEWTLEHLWVTFIACSIAVILGVPLGIYITDKGKEQIADAVLYLAEITMTIPSLAIFGFLMFILAAIGLPSIGFTPAVIALIIYAQLPILRNTYVAIRQVDPAMIEAGKGMGMSERQLLFRVKLPLSVPVIMAGLRTAIVMTIAIATIAAVIGFGGLGQAIWWGIRGARMDLIIAGGVSVAILGLLTDIFLSRVQRWVTPKGLKEM
ncbi:MAG: Glycine betaine/carnitine/choline transport system permease protein OpuCB [Dehalococcoidia bacterium]|nr:Glycine betaine/carnitine/choline transport system permease protein OpuCB [Bacillota bacterium]MBT9143310.1 Glycine betaine/carnitine/choline transport system permease protein OpuCB [Bacillota bacterium]